MPYLLLLQHMENTNSITACTGYPQDTAYVLNACDAQWFIILLLLWQKHLKVHFR